VTILSIDPGACTGWALFGQKMTFAGLQRGLLWCGVWDPTLPFPWTDAGVLVEAIIERPWHRPGDRRSIPNDEIMLALRAGEIGGRVREAYGCPVRYVTPHEWKGSVPKHIHHARLLAKLDECERIIVDAARERIAKSKQHNLLDAVGLGTFGVGR
jgi:hypothetical protein